MRVILAGATGAIGRQLTAALAAAGHQVVGITRQPAAAEEHREQWAAAVIADVLDAEALLAATRNLRADAVIHELTALPRLPSRYRDLDATNRLRVEGTQNLIALAQRVGATRLITQSFLGGYGYLDHGPALRRHGVDRIEEDRPFGRPTGHRDLDPIVSALGEAERLTRTAPGIDGIVLRYGLFYGAGGPLETMLALMRKRQLPLPRRGGGTHSYIWLPDAATATVAALEHGEPGQAYNVCDDQPVGWNTFLDTAAATLGAPRPFRVPGWLFRAAPYAYDVITSTIPMSNAKAKQRLGWTPTAATYADGLNRDRETLASAR